MMLRLLSVLFMVIGASVCWSAEGWPFRALNSGTVPSADSNWGASMVDWYVAKALAEQGLGPSESADRAQLIRRVSLVVLGLPPSTEELDRFLNDAQPGAYTRLIDRVLASPRFGERWAQHWLDVIRFAETWGFETNAFREHAYPYRNWLIESLNSDISFDRFVVEQIAGDALGVDAATGFLVAGPANLPGQIGKDIESQRQARQDELDEVIRTVSEGFWGLTVGCARCHDHKFDPILQRDYYALQAVFSGLRYGHRRLRGEENARWNAALPAVLDRMERLKNQREAFRQRFGLKPSLQPSRQEHVIGPTPARALRMKINGTASGGVASLHELEAWSVGVDSKNVAHEKTGAVAMASSYSLSANQSRHPDNLNDGRMEFPWVADRGGEAWVAIEFPGVVEIDRVVWKRGGGSFPVDYVLEVKGSEGDWIRVADTSDVLLHLEDRRASAAIQLKGVTGDDLGALVRTNRALADAQSERRRLAAGPQVFAGYFQEPETTFLLHRGDPMSRREVVVADRPKVFGSLGLSDETPEWRRRMALAESIASKDEPLAWRVMVNRVWSYYFGRGLVATPSDFGRRGGQPSHAEMLDWLVQRWQEMGGGMKGLHRLILHTETFRQASRSRSKAMQVDAETRLLWRFPPRLLEAEALRDSLLAVSGNLNLEMYGEGFNFFHNRGGLADYRPRTELGSKEMRRMIYSTKMRMTSVEVFGAFNCPDAGQMTAVRSRSITPIQALNLLNSRFVTDQVSDFSRSLSVQADGNVEVAIGEAVRLAFGREPTSEEWPVLRELGSDHGLEAVCRLLLNASDFVMLH